MAYRLAFISLKGGTGKSATCANVAAVLADGGRRVLVVDGDSQGAQAAILGVEATAPTLYEVLIGRAEVGDAIEATKLDGLDLLPANLHLAGAEVELPGRGRDWQLRVREILTLLEPHYDVIAIDAAPGLGVLPYAELLAADAAIAVLVPDFLALRQLNAMSGMLQRAQAANSRLRPLGIVPSMTAYQHPYVSDPPRAQTKHEAEGLSLLASEEVRAVWGPPLPAIPKRVVVQYAMTAGEPVTRYAPSSEPAEAFIQLTEEVRRRAEAQTAEHA
jgi:chromosome partitioning protein